MLGLLASTNVVLRLFRKTAMMEGKRQNSQSSANSELPCPELVSVRFGRRTVHKHLEVRTFMIPLRNSAAFQGVPSALCTDQSHFGSSDMHSTNSPDTTCPLPNPSPSRNQER